MNNNAASLQQAAASFRDGRYGDAADALAPLWQAGTLPPQGMLMYAVACRESGASARCGEVVDRLLKLDPRLVRALVMKAELVREAGDERAATAFYRRAFAEAEGQTNLPADLQAKLREAEQWLRTTQARQQQWLEDELTARGLAPDRRSGAFRQSLDLLSGRKQLYLQQPNLFYYPGLPNVQFYEPEQFSWAAPLEARTDDIRRELDALLEEKGLFRPYVESDPRRPQSSLSDMVDNPSWSALYLWREGKRVADVADRCPVTAAALEETPLARMSVRAPVVMFSLLKAGSRIPPHHGSTNTRLICHLPLIVPSDCGLRVGNETRSWQKGSLLVFDDTIEHEAWNQSGEDRIVLIFDIWRPELSAQERSEVATLFDALDAVGAIGQADSAG